MAKLKGTKIGLALGAMLAILYTLRTIVLLLFPDFVVNWTNKIMYNMISIKTPVITMDAFVTGIIVLFIAGFIWGVVFSAVYNKIVK
ncbi:hypothetical protein J4234_07010 [Candidatus Woesearchaeota archaeon]|nr:hypothetical protein [Candidatus Woesearchaeota archaeon]